MDQSADLHALWDGALPVNGKTNVLTLGENHRDTAHLQYLRKKLPELVGGQRLRTLGFEGQLYYNIFLGAYQSGVLKKQLGSQEKAREYVHAVVIAGTMETEYHPNLDATLDLALDAADQGLKVVFFDTRYPYTRMWENSERYRKELADKIEFAKRLKPARLMELLEDNPNVATAAIALEAHQLLLADPALEQRTDALEKLVMTGEMRQVPYDQLSALALHSIATGNTLTVSGNAHLMGWQQSFAVQGMFPDYLAQLKTEGRPAPQVTKAIIASVGKINQLVQKEREQLRNNNGYILRQEPIPIYDAETGQKSIMPVAEKNDPRLVDLSAKVALNREFSKDMARYLPREFTNALLMPDIKAAADRVSVTFGGKEISR